MVKEQVLGPGTIGHILNLVGYRVQISDLSYRSLSAALLAFYEVIDLLL